MRKITRSGIDLLGFIIVTGSLIVVVSSSFYNYLVLENYSYLITNNCDLEGVECEKMSYYIRASDYRNCNIEGCIDYCSKNKAVCKLAD